MPSREPENRMDGPEAIRSSWSRAGLTPGGRSPLTMLRLPEHLGDPGLLVGWSLELSHARKPIGFGFGDPRKTPVSGYIDPVLMQFDGHLITIAPTGAGEGLGCIIPALLRHEGPIIVIDPKGENVAITARRRREMGQQVVVLDPIGITDQPAAALNPLDLLDATAATTVDEAAALAAILIEHHGDDRNRFWYDRAEHFITGAILHALADHPPEQRNLPTVRSILGLAAGDPEQVMEAMMRSVHPEVRAIARSVSIGAPETRASIIAVAQDGVDFLRGPLVQDATRRTTFDLQSVTLGDPLSIYIVLPPHMLESHGKLLRMWVATLIMAITRRRGRARASTLFLLDEAAQLGTLPQLRQAVTLLRGYGLQTWSFWQDLSQLRLLYPFDWQTMVNNCQVVQCFGSFNSMAATDVAELTGFGSPSAVLDLDAREMILQISGDEPVIARLPNYRLDSPFAGLFDPNPYYDPDQDLMPREPPRIRLYERSPTRPRALVSVGPGGNEPEAVLASDQPDPFLDHLLAGWETGDGGAD